MLIVRKTKREKIKLEDFGLDDAGLNKDIGKRAKNVWDRYNGTKGSKGLYDSVADKWRLNEVVGDVLRSYWRILAQNRPDALDYVLTENVRKFYNLYVRKM